MKTIFQRPAILEPALFNPADTTKAIAQFPEICVSTFSEQIIQKYAALDGVQKIGALFSANGVIPVYKIRYKNTDIAFYMSRVGAPACVAGFEEIIAMGAKKFVLFGSCGVLDDGKVKDRSLSLLQPCATRGRAIITLLPRRKSRQRQLPSKRWSMF